MLRNLFVLDARFCLYHITHSAAGDGSKGLWLREMKYIPLEAEREDCLYNKINKINDYLEKILDIG